MSKCRQYSIAVHRDVARITIRVVVNGNLSTPKWRIFSSELIVDLFLANIVYVGV